MKKYLLLALIALMAVACTSQYERNLQKMERIIKKQIEDEAFKNNMKVELLEFKVVSYDTINENVLDTFRMITNQSKIDFYAERHRELLKEAKDKYYMAGLASSLNAPDMAKHDFDEAEDLAAEVRKIADSLVKYIQIDSTLRAKIESRKSSSELYRMKAFIKATITAKDGSTNNVMDSIYYIFDENLNQILVE
nr:MAG TPA: Protein involved in gliding motility 9 Secretion System Type.5A [Caudoviricetes sp.]